MRRGIFFGEEPVEARALTLSKRGDKRFGKVEEMVSALLIFPGARVAQFTASFGSTHVASLELVGATGMLRLDSAYSYSEPVKWTRVIEGKKKEISSAVARGGRATRSHRLFGVGRLLWRGAGTRGVWARISSRLAEPRASRARGFSRGSRGCLLLGALRAGWFDAGFFISAVAWVDPGQSCRRSVPAISSQSLPAFDRSLNSARVIKRDLALSSSNTLTC